MQRALLVRHCESSGPAPDAALTPRGSEQALALATFLAAYPIDRVVSSPYRRARATIEPFAQRAGLAIELHDGLVERRLSAEPVDGWRKAVARSFREPDFRLAGGESGAEARARGWAALHDVLRGTQQLAVIVSHGQLMSWLLHSIDPAFGYAEWEALSNPDVYAIEVAADGALAFERFWR